MKKLMFGILMAFGLVSVSFGADLFLNKKHYQKLKAEVEEYDLVDFEKRCYKRDLDHIKNVIAFFDEIRATDVKGAKTEWEEYTIAIRKVMEMPRFRNDSSIYAVITTFDGNRKANFRSEEGFWKDVWNKWEMTKLELESCGAKKGYWEAVKKESE